MPTLEDAIILAVNAHRGQLDKAGAPYILHPLHLMMQMHSETAKIVAVLHDVVEDTPYTLDDLVAQGYPPDVVEAVNCVTRREEEAYDEFIERLAPNPLARAVKIADLKHNMDIRRLPHFTERTAELLRRYHRAWGRLMRESKG
jgi:(p)ppGpp synthase/HD superfamily hydrolase